MCPSVRSKTFCILAIFHQCYHNRVVVIFQTVRNAKVSYLFLCIVNRSDRIKIMYQAESIVCDSIELAKYLPV